MELPLAVMEGGGMAAQTKGELLLFDQAHDKSHHRQDNEYEEQNLRNAHGAGRNTAESKDGSDQSNDQKNDGVSQHKTLPKVVTEFEVL